MPWLLGIKKSRLIFNVRVSSGFFRVFSGKGLVKLVRKRGKNAEKYNRGREEKQWRNSSLS